MIMSAGIAAMTGGRASLESAQVMQEQGIDLGHHESQPLTQRLVRFADLILTMTSGHKDLIQLQYPDLKVPVYRFREWLVGESREVPDPYGGPLDIYLETRDSLVEAVPSIITYIRNSLIK